MPTPLSSIQTELQGLAVTHAGLRIGIDTVSLAEVSDALRDFGQRYVQRLFTPGERAHAESAPARTAERLAARFAAKEAAIKALNLSEAGIDWRDIEVLRDAGGRPSLALHGRAALALTGRPPSEIAVSLSHDPVQACAVVAVLPLRPAPANPSAGRSSADIPVIRHCTESSTAMDLALDTRIRAILDQHGRLDTEAASLSATADLYEAGLSSHASVNVMLALEAAFDLEFPDRLLTRSSFQSVLAIRSAVTELIGD